MTQPTYGIAITADDKTAKGVASAERRIGGIPKRVDSANRSSIGKSSKAILRTFAETEKAGAKAFGGRSVMAGVASRMGAIGEAAGAMGEGMGAAAAEGGLLTTVLGGVGAAVAGTIGALVAAGVAAFNVANGWSKTAATIGRTSEIIGVGTKALQEFSAAAERMGVDKDKALGGLGGLSQSLNDARYGRNTQVIGLLNKLGVKMAIGADGDVDVEKMLPAIADAFSRQGSSGKRTMARILGVPLDTIPVFSQGGKALSGDMADTEKTGIVLTPDDIALGKRQVRRNTIGSQELQGKILTPLKRGLTGGIDGAETWAMNKLGIGADTIDRAGGKMDRAADKMDRAARNFSTAGGGGGVRNGVLGMSPKDVVDLKKLVQTEWDGRNVNQLKGIVDVVLNRVATGRWGRTVADVANAHNQFSDINGPNGRRKGRHSVDDVPLSLVTGKTSAAVDAYLQDRASGKPSIVGGALNYANPYYSDEKNKPWIYKLDGPTFGSGKSIHKYGTVPGMKDSEPGDFSIGLPGAAPQEVPVKVTVELKNAPPGTRATVTAGKSSKPAVSWALAPVHGG